MYIFWTLITFFAVLGFVFLVYYYNGLTGKDVFHHHNKHNNNTTTAATST